MRRRAFGVYSKKSLVSTIVTWKPVCRWSSSCSTWLGFGFGFGLELGFGFGFGFGFGLGFGFRFGFGLG